MKRRWVLAVVGGVLPLGMMVVVGLMLAGRSAAAPAEPGPEVPAAEAVVAATEVDERFPDWWYIGDQDAGGGTGGVGATVSAAGDVNDDGWDDVIVGAPYYDDGGVVYVFHGDGDSLSSSPVYSASGGQNAARFGAAIATGSVNDDACADVIVGAPNAGTAEKMKPGRIDIFYGCTSEAGLSQTPDRTVYGEQHTGDFGYAVAIAGDVDGDGLDDVIVGAPAYSSGAGKVYVLGSSADMTTTSAWAIEGGQPGARFGAAVGSVGDGDGCITILVGAHSYDVPGAVNAGAVFVYDVCSLGSSPSSAGPPKWTGEKSGAQFGAAVSGAGDVNGDGYDDVIVGAPGYRDTWFLEGGAFVYHGSSSGLSATPRWQETGEQEYAQFGTSVGGAGDVNGDGYGDVIVGSPYYTVTKDSESTPSVGRAFVFGGSRLGLVTAASLAPDKDKADEHFGYSVSAAGDVNGDGLGDVIVGAPGYRSETRIMGAAFAYLGAPGIFPVVEIYDVYLPLVVRQTDGT